MPSNLLEGPSEQARPSRAADGLRRTILIIEDDRSQAQTLCQRLEKQGYTTAVADSGQRGLALARSRRPDLVLLDLRLPDADGFSVCEQLVDAPETCASPVIILSAMERPDIVRTSRAAGCQYFVRKPYDPNALLTLIRHALDEAQEWNS